MVNDTYKPCPFCGNAEAPCMGIRAFYGKPETMKHFVICNPRLDGCGAMSGCYGTQEEALDAWNMRP